MKRLVRTLAIVAALAAPALASAQDNVEVTAGADLVSGYIWRGQDLGNAAIQPTVGVAYKGLSVTAWGSYGIADKDDTKELDLTVAYTVGGFTIGVTDYYAQSGDGQCNGKYFLYDAHKTAHVFEANLGYDFGPVALNWYTNFAGADGVNKDGDRAYSSYFQMDAPFKLGGLDWNATLGVAPFATDYYEKANKFAVTDITVKATKEINVTPSFKLPLFAALTANPSTQKFYLTAGLTF